MRRRSSTPSVTLFPFLAVLVCTKGALIFLLLVTTRRIQLQANLPVVAIESSLETTVLSPESIPAPVYPVVQSLKHLEDLLGPTLPLVDVNEPDPFDVNEPILPLLAGNALEDNEWLQAEWDAEQAARRREYEAELAKRNRRQKKINDDWQQKVQKLSQELAKQETEASQLSTQGNQLQAELDSLQVKNEKTKSRLDNIQIEQKKVGQFSQQRTTEQTRLLNEAAELTRQIARLEEEFANLAPETEIVAYDSLTGTSRKPILIECREKEIVFAAEGVVLSAKELSGFPPEYNPLKAGAEALVKYWAKHSQAGEKPYILLVVRPEGTTGFYVARGLLSKMDYSFGYELIDTDTDLKWPATDSEAMIACQEAVFSTLQDRDRVATRIGRGFSGSKGPLNYSNAAGDFHLPELDSMNRSGSRNFIGDEKWIPPKRNQLDTMPRISSSSRSSSPLNRPSLDSGTLQLQQPRRNQSNESATEPVPSESPQRIFGDQLRGQREQLRAPRAIPTTSAKPIEGRDIPVLLPPNPFDTKRVQQPGDPSDGIGVRVPQPRRNGIGIEREVELHLWPNRLRIDDGLALTIPDGTSSADFKSAVTSVVGKTAGEWETAPNSYFWKPMIKIVIHPGGLMHYAKTKELVDQWGVPSKVEYEIQ